MKSLLNKTDFTYEREAVSLNREVSEVISPIIEKWVEKGYSPREIQIIILDAVSLEVTLQHAKLVVKNK
jgi:hypothetical protein